ncbi:MAG: M1 family metallopeptidase [Bacteroidota bacterium]
MKRYPTFLLLIILAGILYFGQEEVTSFQNQKFHDASKYSGGILKTEESKVQAIANYNIDVELNAETKTIYAKENVTWINRTKELANEIQFHFYANGYKNNKTLFAQAYPINSETKTGTDVKVLKVDGQDSHLIYFQPDVADPYDSTVAKVLLNKPVLPGDSVRIYFEYAMKIPLSVKRLGYASGRNFFFVSQWFPKVGVFENGKWICSQYHPYLNFFSDFGKYSVHIKVPKNYIVAATGVETEKSIIGQSAIFRFIQSGVHDFVWLASDDILHRSEVYTRNDGSQIAIQAFVQPEREKYFSRYFEAVKNCLRFFEDNIGIYPYQNITLVDVPRTSAVGGMEYPTLFTVSAELFSPKGTGWPEYLVAHEFSHQFYQGLLANNEVYEAWLDEGFASYIATKIMYKFYPDIYENFKVASYMPVYGMNFLSYKDIPLLYTLAQIQVPEGARSLSSYYRNLRIGTIADTSYKLPTRLSYVVNSYNKPELMLHTLERYMGREKMMKILKDYYDEFKYHHPTAKNFISVVQKNSNEDMNWFFDEFYRSAKVFDYKVAWIRKVGTNDYDVMLERLADGVFKNDVALYTDKDTLYQKWDGKDLWYIMRFHTTNEVIGAEIDPFRKNLLDINFANNSYTTHEQIGASLSISMRWFFWIQNALMIIGSIG